MGMIILIVFFIALAIGLPTLVKAITEHPAAHITAKWVRYAFGALAAFMVAATSFVHIGKDEVGLLHRVYLADNLPTGHIIALSGEKGPQARILGPGFHVIPLLNILYDVETRGVIEVPENHYGYLVAKDGEPLPAGSTYAPAFGPGRLDRMLDAAFFLTQGNGYAGPQTSVLPPRKYRINPYLWEVKTGPVTEVPKGHVGVIKSNVRSPVTFGELTTAMPKDCSPTKTTDASGDALAVPLVPIGCVGIWDKPILPGKYYINERAFDVTIVDTRVQAWPYVGGYTKRIVDLTVDANGEIKQVERSHPVEVPQEAADSAIGIKIDGYTINQGVRALIQVDPNDAPFIVASVGSLREVEDRIITPAIQSTTRDLSGQFIDVTEPIIDEVTGKPKLDEETGDAIVRTVRRPIQPLDLIERREILQLRVEEKIRPEGRKAGVNIKEIRFLEPDLPPEVLIPRKRQQLAFEMIRTMQQEQKAQKERIDRENAKATADQQESLVQQQIAVQKAILEKERKLQLGEAEKLYLTEQAKGQEAQANVLGKDKVFQLRLAETLLDKLGEHPDLAAYISKLVPDTLVINGGPGDLSSLGAMLKRGIEKK